MLFSYMRDNPDASTRQSRPPSLAWYTRTTDVVSRFGGEEFLVVFTGVTERDVQTLVMRIMEAVREEEWLVDGKALTVTVSAGAVCVSELTDEPAIRLK